MNATEKKRQLQAEIASMDHRISNCKHEFKAPIYDPETVREGYGSRIVTMGSDPYFEYEGYHEVQKDRWSRECNICGHKQYTHEKGPVISGYEPKF